MMSLDYSFSLSNDRDDCWGSGGGEYIQQLKVFMCGLLISILLICTTDLGAHHCKSGGVGGWEVHV